MAPKIVNHDKKRADIINYSYSFFIRHGIKNATLDNLLKFLNMGKGTFYYYFSSKDELVNSIFDELAKEYIQYVEYKLFMSRNLEKSLEVLFDIYLNDSKQNKDFLNLYNEYILIYSSKSDEKVNLINQKYQDYLNKTIRKSIQKEIDKGILKEEALEFVSSISATIDGMLIHSSILKDYNLQKELKQYIKQLIKLLKKDVK